MLSSAVKDSRLGARSATQAPLRHHKPPDWLKTGRDKRPIRRTSTLQILYNKLPALALASDTLVLFSQGQTLVAHSSGELPAAFVPRRQSRLFVLFVHPVYQIHIIPAPDPKTLLFNKIQHLFASVNVCPALADFLF